MGASGGIGIVGVERDIEAFARELREEMGVGGDAC